MCSVFASLTLDYIALFCNAIRFYVVLAGSTLRVRIRMATNATRSIEKSLKIRLIYTQDNHMGSKM